MHLFQIWWWWGKCTQLDLGKVTFYFFLCKMFWKYQGKTPDDAYSADDLEKAVEHVKSGTRGTLTNYFRLVIVFLFSENSTLTVSRLCRFWLRLTHSAHSMLLSTWRMRCGILFFKISANFLTRLLQRTQNGSSYDCLCDFACLRVEVWKVYPKNKPWL